MNFKLKILLYLVYVKLGKWVFNAQLLPLQKMRFKRLKKTLKKSPYYQTYITKNVILNEFPVIEKTQFMQKFDSINTCNLTLNRCMEVALKAENSRNFSPMIQGVSVGLSTGTSGNRGLFLVSENERAMWVACILDRVIGFSLRKRKVAFFMRANNNLYQSTESKILQFQFFDIFIPMEKHFEKLAVLNPDILVAQPSVLCLLAEAISNGKITVSPQKIISIAEVLTEEDREYLEKVFKQTIHQIYQCTEGFLAASCKYGSLHFNEDFIHIEKKYINEEKTKFHPIITDLLRSSQPVIRYELNDIITEKKHCACGSKMLAIEKIEGRSDDILVFENKEGQSVQLFPDLFRRTIVLSNDTITDYFLVQENRKSLKLFIKSIDPNAFDNSVFAITRVLAQYAINNVSIKRLSNAPFSIGEKKRRIKNETAKIN